MKTLPDENDERKDALLIMVIIRLKSSCAVFSNWSVAKAGWDRFWVLSLRVYAALWIIQIRIYYRRKRHRSYL